MQWIDLVLKPLALILGYSLKTSAERRSESERKADARARRKFK